MFTLILDKEQASKHAKTLARLPGRGVDELEDGGLLRVKYSLWLTYLGETAKTLSEINKLLADHDILIDVSTEEVKHGQCIVEDLFGQLTVTKRIIANRGNGGCGGSSEGHVKGPSN